MEVIVFLIFVLIVYFFLVVSNKKKIDKHNQYDAFTISGIGQSSNNNALFNTRKLPKNKANNTEFYISDKVAGKILIGEEKAPDSKLIGNISPISKLNITKAKPDPLDQSVEEEHLIKENKEIAKEEQDDYQNLINEILAPVKQQNNQNNETPGDLSDVEDKLAKVLEESKSVEDIERKETARSAKIDIDDRDTTRRFKKVNYMHKKDNTNPVEKELFESVDKILQDVEELKNNRQNKSILDNVLSNDLEQSKTENSFDYIDTTSLDEKYSYLDDFLSSYKKEEPATPSYQDLNSDSFIKKADKILKNYETHFENIKKPYNEKNDIKFEELHSRIKKHERSEVIDEWKKKLGFH